MVYAEKHVFMMPTLWLVQACYLPAPQALAAKKGIRLVCSCTFEQAGYCCACQGQQQNNWSVPTCQVFW